MTTPSAKRNGIQGSGRLVTGLLVSGACLFALLLVGLSGPVLGEGGKCVPTVEDAEGPFYKPGAPERLSTGSGLAVSGEVLSYPGCRAVPGARVEWWHADRTGRYVDSLRGMQKTGESLARIAELEKQLASLRPA